MDEKSSNNKLLTRDRLNEIGAYVGSTHGTQLIARFCNAIKDDQTPPAEDLKILAHALEPLIAHYQNEKVTPDNRLRNALDDFARRIKLKKKQGKGGSESFANAERMADSVARHFNKVTDLVSSGASKKEAEKQALNWSSGNEQIGPKAMKNRIKKYKEMAETLNHMHQNWK